MPPHHLDNLHPAVRPGGRARAFDDFRDVAQSRVKAECVVSAGKVLINRLRNSQNLHATFGELGGDPKRIFAATRNDRIEL